MSVDYDDDAQDPGPDDFPPTPSPTAGSTPTVGAPPPPRPQRCGFSPFESPLPLFNDVICEELAGDTARGCAIVMDGPNAEIDCRGYTVSQVSQQGAAQNCDAISLNPLDPLDSVKVKQECGLSYAYGICLLNGAKAKNCNVDGFAAGIYVFSDTDSTTSEVSNSKVVANRFGLLSDTDVIVSNS